MYDMVKVSGGNITERLHTAGGSALSSSVLRQSSLQDVTEHFYGVTLALVWHYYVQRSQHYDTLDVTDIKDSATCLGGGVAKEEMVTSW